MPNLEDAILLAVEAHRGQKDTGGAPYILHPLRVMLKVNTDSERMAAILHDVVEDTPVTLENLRNAGYPEPVLEAIDCLTRRKGESYEDFIRRIKPNPIARKIKLADLEDNMDLSRISSPQSKDLERVDKYRKFWTELRALG